MGTLKTTNIQSISGSGTVTLGVSGETFDIPSGVTLDSTGATITGALANTPAFMAYISGGNQMVSDDTFTLIAANAERLDTDSCYNATTYRFTPTAAGEYLAFAYVEGYSDGASQMKGTDIYLKKNGSIYHRTRFDMSNNEGALIPNTLNVIVAMNGTTDYLEFFGKVNGTAGNQSFVGDADTQTYLSLIHI